ncbi:ACP S-malonyltransferase [Actinokineospora sp. 24-640]
MARTPVFLFAGQGAQYHGMGRGLRDADPVFRAVLRRLDDVVVAERGESLLAALHHDGVGAEVPLSDFRHSQPGIFMIEYALAEMVLAHGFTPAAVLGASLGEVAAAAVAGVFDPEDCLRLLLAQVDLFALKCPPGGMLAVLADPALARTDPVLAATHLAAVNSPGNFVLAGTVADLDRAEAHLFARGVLCQRLPVPYPFHSPLIDPVEAAFKALVSGMSARPARIPLLSATSGGPVRLPDPAHLWRVLRDPFDVPATLGPLLTGEHLFLDLGPSGSMANLVRAALPAGSTAKSLPLLSPYARDEALLTAVLAEAPARTEVPPVTTLTAPTPSTTTTADALRVWVFPGQGAQSKGMGRELFDRFPDLVARADAVLGYSLRELCLEDPGRDLRRTEYTQPALFAVEALTWLAAVQEGGRLPDVVLGHSLGEYAALFAAGAFDFETGLALVRERGRLMGAAGGGRMAAVSGITAERVAEVLRDNGLDRIDIANYNSPLQTVIAGPDDAIEASLPLFTAAGARCAPLNVSAPFHSRYMEPAAAEFAAVLARTRIAAPKIPVLANAEADFHTPDGVADALRRQITAPVRWTESVRVLMGLGPFELRELGPGQVLTKLVARIRDEATPLPRRPLPVSLFTTAAPAPARQAPTAERLGSAEFRADHGVRLSYVVGGMHEGVSSPELVARLAKSRVLSFLGAPGLPAAEVADAIARVRALAGADAPFGVNLTHDPFTPNAEIELVDVVLRTGVRAVEVSTYVEASAELVRLRLSGARVNPDGTATPARRVLAKVTRADIARVFLSPAPSTVIAALRARGRITDEEAEAGALLALADDVCAVGDAADYTDQGALWALLPSIRAARAEVGGPATGVRVGAGGGIGTPEAAAAAFVLGADFVLTGSVNLATAESGMSAAAKDLLVAADAHDTAYAPYGGLFELGARARVLKRGVLFPARAGRLYDLWRNHDSWQAVPSDVRARVERDYLGMPFDQVPVTAEPDPKRRMALVFRWYCARARQWAISGDPARVADYQVAAGPAVGACNQWLRGTDLADWRARHADELADRIMAGAALAMAG